MGNKDLDAAGKTYLYKTLYCKKTLDPTWGETFTLESHRPDEEYLRYYVFDKEPLIHDHIISWAEIPLAELRATGYSVRVIHLNDAKGRSDKAGEIHTEITFGSGYPGGGAPPQAYYPPQGYYPPQPQQPPPQQPPPQQPPPQQTPPPQPQPTPDPPKEQPPPPQPQPTPDPPKELPPPPQPQPTPDPPKEQPKEEEIPKPELDPETKKLAQSLGIDDLHLHDAYLKFQEVDVDHSGTISYEELKILLHVTVAKMLHDDVLDRYAHVEFSSVDSDHNGEISFLEFLQVYASLKTLQANKQI